MNRKRTAIPSPHFLSSVFLVTKVAPFWLPPRCLCREQCKYVIVKHVAPESRGSCVKLIQQHWSDTAMIIVFEVREWWETVVQFIKGGYVGDWTRYSPDGNESIQCPSNQIFRASNLENNVLKKGTTMTLKDPTVRVHERTEELILVY